MKISFAICTHNESKKYLEKLFTGLFDFITISKPDTSLQFEIVVVDDYSINAETVEFLQHIKTHPNVIFTQHKHNRNFADHKNHLTSLCTGDWIVNVDADEFLPLALLSYIPQIIDANPNVEAYWVPRANIVTGLTHKEAGQYNWILYKLDNELFRTLTSRETIDQYPGYYDFLKGFQCIIKEEGDSVLYENPLIMWPDFQMRIYKNASHIKWKNKVHEQLHGYNTFSRFPADPMFAIMHFKDLERQQMQNKFYDTL